ncbi:MAG: hypothetical protein ACOY0T_17855 [Myxococcota bacterium]
MTGNSRVCFTRSRRGDWLFASALWLAGCHARTPVADAPTPGPVAAQRPAKARASKPPDPPTLRATELARVQSATFGPYLGMRSDGALVVWAALEGNERRFSATQLSATGRPVAPAAVLGSAPQQLGVVAVRGLRDGYALLFTRPGEKGEHVEALCVTANAQARGAAKPVAETAGRALWVELIPVEQGALALYAVRSGERQKAELWAVAIDSQCRAVERTLLFKNALAWQAAPAPKGAFVSAVQSSEGGNLVSVEVLDSLAKVKATTRVSSEPGADLDMDAASLGDRLIVAWTDRKLSDPSVVSAVVDASGKLLAPPERLTAPEGEQALVRLVPPSADGKRAFVAFERLEVRASSGRSFSLSALNDVGRLAGPRVDLIYSQPDGTVPEFAAIGDALAALTLAPACRRGASCERGEVARTYVRFDDAFKPIVSEPLRLESLQGGQAELNFGLGCFRENCVAISAPSRMQAPIFAAHLEPRSNAWQPPVRPLPTPTPPRVKEFESVARADSLAGISVASAGERDWLAYITDFDDTTPWKLLERPAPDGRREPLRAQVALTRLEVSERVRTLPTPIQVSLRAYAVGGVAVAPGDAARGDVLVAWAGLDAGTPQLFVTLYDKTGAKLNQRMLTRKKGELSDIVCTWVGDGWVLAWVDERNLDPEVYATKIDLKLNRTAPEQRITNTEGSASDLNLAFDGTSLRLAWSDSRGSDVSEHADIYSARLRPRDAAREGNEVRVAATRPHSFGPKLHPANGGFALAWIERGDNENGGRLAMTQITADGGVGPVASTGLAEEAEPTGVALDCIEKGCRFLLTSEGGPRNEVLVGSWDGTNISKVSAILPFAGRGGIGVAPVLRGHVGWLPEKASESARVRRLELEW